MRQKDNAGKTKPLIGISECLTNSIVRYDAKSQFNKTLLSDLSEYFELLPVCPEVECGLGVPRPPVELVEMDEAVNVIGRDNKSLNVTEPLISYCRHKVLSLKNLSGYVFKARSPSCGVLTTPVHNLKGNIKRYTNGVFVEALLKQYPLLPIADDSMIDKQEAFDVFVENILSYNTFVPLT